MVWALGAHLVRGFCFKAIGSIKLSLFEKNKTVTIVNSKCVRGLPQCCCCCCCLHSCFVFFFRVFFPVSRVSFAAIRTVQNSIGVLETLLE